MRSPVIHVCSECGRAIYRVDALVQYRDAHRTLDFCSYACAQRHRAYVRAEREAADAR